MITPIPVNKLDSVWHTVSPLLAKALEYNNELDLNDVLDGILREEYLLMVAVEAAGIKAAFVLEMVEKPLKRICNIMLCGGTDMDSWLTDYLDQVYVIAEAQGADSVYVMGRPGWKKILASHGFKQIGSIYEHRS